MYRIIIFLLISLYVSFPSCAADKKDESSFDRVIRSGKIRCGYYVFPPVTMRDPNTGELSGYSVDFMEEIGERAGLEIKWTEEITFGNWAPALQSKRFDAVCTPMWPDIPMSRAVSFTKPMYYTKMIPLVRVDDNRFDGAGLDRLNQPDVTFIVQDGNAQSTLTRAVFPNAEIKAIAAGVEGPVMMQEIYTGKADAIVLDINGVVEYNKHNDIKLRAIEPDNPIKIQPFSLVVGRNDLILIDFLDNAITELQNDGTVNRLLDKWETVPGLYMRASKPYEIQK